MPPRRTRPRRRRTLAPLALRPGDPGSALDEWVVVDEEAVAEDLADQLLTVAPELPDALSAERTAATVPATWWSPGLGRRSREDAERGVAEVLVPIVEDRGDGDALAALRVLELTAAEPVVALARAASGRLHRRGLADPDWWPRVDELRPTGARMAIAPDCPGDVMLLLQFDRVGEASHTLIASIRAAQGGTMGLIDVGPPLSVLDGLQERADRREAERERDADARPGADGEAADDEDDVAFVMAHRPIGLGEAAAMLRKAIRRTDALGTAGPIDDYAFGRALALRRLPLLLAADGPSA